MTSSARILVILGTRPEAIKLAPIIQALRKTKMAVRVCATGQHTDLLMQGLACFNVSVDRMLAVMDRNQEPLMLCNRIVEQLNPVLHEVRPAWMVVQGDTASAFASALAAFHHRIPVAHVEAGLRTGDPFHPWPEEMYRRLLTPLATLHFAPTQRARENLLHEGVSKNTIEVTGNTIIDALRIATNRVAESPVLAEIATSIIHEAGGKHLIVVTVHRRENLGAPLGSIANALIRLARRGDCCIVLPAHPNPAIRHLVTQISGCDNVLITAPMEYLAFVTLLRSATIVLTDSGGIQEEATALGKPVLVLRTTTERQESICVGNACLVGTSESRIVAETERLLDDRRARSAMERAHDSYGDGHAADRIIARLLLELESSNQSKRAHTHNARIADITL